MALRQTMAILAVIFLSVLVQAQPQPGKVPGRTTDTERSVKPYRILTSGKQITVKSDMDIKSIIVWTSGGHRILENKEINTDSYSFRITVREKIFFIRVQLADGNTYSEKIGVN